MQQENGGGGAKSAKSFPNVRYQLYCPMSYADYKKLYTESTQPNNHGKYSFFQLSELFSHSADWTKLIVKYFLSESLLTHFSLSFLSEKKTLCLNALSLDLEDLSASGITPANKPSCALSSVISC